MGQIFYTAQTIYLLTIFYTTAVLARICVTPLTGCQPLQQDPHICPAAKLYSAPDDCGCLHWHCDSLQNEGGGAACPRAWSKYVNSAGATLCVKVFPDTADWQEASENCDREHNSDLFNVRQFEEFSEFDDPLKQRINEDLANKTNMQAHWSGLHMSHDKLYWDAEYPSPDRDLTTQSSSRVSFNEAHWQQLRSNRRCIFFTGGAQLSTNLQPQYCTARYPYICYKKVPAAVDSYYMPSNNMLCGGKAGWFGSEESGLCYKYFGALMSHAEAVSTCTANGAILADPRYTIKQMFLVGMLSGMDNGTAPTAVHIGMERTASNFIKFSSGGTSAPALLLGVYQISGNPTSSRECGVLWNPYFASGRDDPDMFSECSVARPFICTQSFTPETAAANARLEVSRSGNTLTCVMTGLDNVVGNVVWLKDHQYFPKQDFTPNITLTSDDFKRLSDDISNRTVGKGELAGVYTCEFWQAIPKKQYKSQQLYVTFNDTTNLRMSTKLDEISWNSELEAFNYRVSQRDELSQAVQAVYDVLMTRVQVALSNISREGVQFGVNLISISKTDNDKVQVEYRITLSGDEVARSLTSSNTMSNQSSTFLDTVISTLSQADTLTEQTPNQTISIAGQNICLELIVDHSQTLESFTLPMKTSGAEVILQGDCYGVTETMVKAVCRYSEESLKSTWQYNFSDCSANCLSSTITHPMSNETYELPEGREGANFMVRGQCGHKQQDMINATCDGNQWIYSELLCEPSCESSTLNHTQMVSSFTESEYFAGNDVTYSILCNGLNTTILSALCAISGQWINVVKTYCVPTCPAQDVRHPSGTELHIDSSGLNTSKTLTGVCDNQRIALVSATCSGDMSNGGSWNITFMPCDVFCPNQPAEHPSVGTTWTLETTPLNEVKNLSGKCNNETVQLAMASCIGTHTTGGEWNVTYLPCEVSCDPLAASHPIGTTWRLPPLEIDSRMNLTGDCDGERVQLAQAVCSGSLENGASMNITYFPCEVSCAPMIATHPTTGASWELQSTQLGNESVLSGQCDNQTANLVEATCGGHPTTGGVWSLTYLPCNISCAPTQTDHPITGSSWGLQTVPLGHEATLDGLCGNQTVNLARIKCDGSPTEGALWNVTHLPCEVSCPAKTETHPVTGTIWNLAMSSLGFEFTLDGLCNNISTSSAIAVCDGHPSTGAVWNVTFLPCESSCGAARAVHPDTNRDWQLDNAELGHEIILDGQCANQSTNLAKASCDGTPETGGKWNITYVPCHATCSPRTATHPIGTSWVLEESQLGHEVLLSGKCDNQTANLARATCTGDHANGGTWDINYHQCEAGCEAQTFIHPDTNVDITLNAGLIGEERTVELLCNGYPMPVKVSCVGTVSNGASWRLLDIPECSPRCPERQWYDTVTLQNYTVNPVRLNAHSTVKALCGGVEMVRLISECKGDIVTGVFWEDEEISCNPACMELEDIHPNTQAKITFPSLTYGQSYEVIGRCDGKNNYRLAVALCGGNKALGPTWENITMETCVGFCESLPVSYNEEGREPYQLTVGQIGDGVTTNSTCALREMIEISAQCVGTAEDGGEWKYVVTSCDVDTSCPAYQFVHPETKMKLLSEETIPGDTAVEVNGDCHGEEKVMLTVVCEAVLDGRGQWVDEIYSECETDMTDQLTNLLDFYKDNPLALASLTAELSENVEDLTPEQVDLMVDIVEFVAAPETPKEILKEGEFFFDIVSNMMVAPLDKGSKRKKREAGDKSGEGDTEMSASNRLAMAVEGFVKSAAFNESRVTLERENLLIEVLNTEKLGSHENPSLIMDSLQVSLPHSVANGSNVAFVKYNTPVLFTTSKALLGDTVFSATVAEQEVTDTEGAIIFTINIPGNSSMKGLKPVCAYYNFNISNWSTDGCEKIKEDNTTITCQCDHLTNFAILMDIAGQENYISEAHHTALSIITTVGLSISIVALSLHLLSFMFIVKLRQNQFQKVLANLALAILVSNVVFLAGIDKTTHNNACIAVAALLHYFILASFSWMFVEAFMQYRRFVKVLGTHVTHILLKAGLPAWIAPIVPVAIVLIIDPQLYRGGENFCWMKPEPLYYSFLLPIGIVILANIVLFILILRGLTCARPTKLRTNRSESEMRMMYFKAGLAVFTLLGLTWIFGFLAISDARLAFQYLFCITNAFQGLVIFLLHNIRDPKVQAWWRKVLHMKPLPGKGSSTMRTGYSTTKSSYSVTNSSVVESSSDSANKDSPVQAGRKLAASKGRSGNDSMKSTTPLTSKYLQLEQSKLMHSSVESDASATSSSVTANSDV